MALAEAIVQGKVPDVRPPARTKLAPFVKVINILRAESRQVSQITAHTHPPERPEFVFHNVV